MVNLNMSLAEETTEGGAAPPQDYDAILDVIVLHTTSARWGHSDSGWRIIILYIVDSARACWKASTQDKK